MKASHLLASSLLTCTPLFGQVQTGSAAYMKHAQVADSGSGTIQVTANSPRPLSQALEAIRR